VGAKPVPWCPLLLRDSLCSTQPTIAPQCFHQDWRSTPSSSTVPLWPLRQLRFLYTAVMKHILPCHEAEQLFKYWQKFKLNKSMENILYYEDQVWSTRKHCEKHKTISLWLIINAGTLLKFNQMPPDSSKRQFSKTANCIYHSPSPISPLTTANSTPKDPKSLFRPEN
jgi:hypothetical protein